MLRGGCFWGRDPVGRTTVGESDKDGDMQRVNPTNLVFGGNPNPLTFFLHLGVLRQDLFFSSGFFMLKVTLVPFSSKLLFF